MVNVCWWPTDADEQPNGRLVRNPFWVQGLKVHDPFFQFLKPKASLFFGWRKPPAASILVPSFFDAPNLAPLKKSDRQRAEWLSERHGFAWITTCHNSTDSSRKSCSIGPRAVVSWFIQTGLGFLGPLEASNLHWHQ